ncbi:MAG: hypothetical protein AB7U82_29985 [Blastocatellales bacterium]
MKEEKKKRLVVAPQAGRADSSGQIISVELNEDEDVSWQWTHYPDGTSAVTGYEIVKKTEEKSERSKR